MSFLDIVRSGVAIANSLTQPLQATVIHQAFTVADGAGKQTPLAPVSRPALVEMKQKQVRNVDGLLVWSQASVVFLDPSVTVHLFDQITLPDGTTGPILSISGFVDKGTGTPVLTEVYLG